MTDNKHNTSGDSVPTRLGRLIDGHAAVLELYAAGWCDCPEDVVQEAFIELAACPKWPDNPVAWLYRVVRNRGLNASRARRRRRRHEQEAAALRSAVLTAPPGEAIDGGELAKALASLPEVEREVVVARLWGGLNYREIGELIGSSESTAHRYYQRALTKLRKRVNPSWVDSKEKTN